MFEYYSGKKIMITGVAGFIASHLSDALLEAGAEILGVDNFITGRRENIAHLSDNPKFTLIEADVSGSPDLYLPEGYVPDVIFHLASPASPPRYQEHPVATYLVSSVAIHNLLQFLLKQNPDGRFVYASTSEVYGDPLEHPQKEEYWGNVNPNGPRSCYDEAKRLGETICGVHVREHDMDVRIMRIFNTYGPRMDPLDGRVIPNLMLQALKQQPFTIFGDGSQTRSYCYVSDLVLGIQAMGSVDDAKGETVNLGNPGEYTITETAEVIQKITQTNEQIVYEPLPKDDPMRRKPDISKATALLGWQPTITLEDGLMQSLEYFKACAAR